MKRKMLKPRKDVEYTFIFANNKEYTLRYYGENEAGKLVFMNVDTKKFTAPLTLARFNYLISRQLKSQRAVAPIRIETYIPRESERIEESVDERWLRKLKSPTAEQKNRLEEYFGKTIEKIKADYSQALQASNNMAELATIRYGFIKAFAVED